MRLDLNSAVQGVEKEKKLELIKLPILNPVFF
jgi:hypothetical protein